MADESISAITGTITVEVGDDVTIGSISTGKVFEVDGKSYIVSSIGLSDGLALKEISSSVITDTLEDTN
jgi:hypothetical protein